MVRIGCKTIVKRQRFLYNQEIKRKILDFPVNDRSFWSFAKAGKQNFSESFYPPLILDS
jgi:hypothetical protein